VTYDCCVTARLLCSEAEAKHLADLILETLGDEVSASSAFEEPDGRWRAEFFLSGENAETRLHDAVREYGGERLSQALVFETLAPQDWIAKSLAGLQPVGAGRFVVHGAHDRARIAPNRIGIEIEAALAFGTGHHGTTLGCLRAIGRLSQARNVLDVGTGTGVLAIAAARAFKAPVTATEIDPPSVLAARENVRNNRAGGFVTVLKTGVLGDAVRRNAPYDLVLANILLPVLKALSRDIVGVLAPRATLVLSGLLPHQAEAALARYAAQGLRLVRREVIDNWATLTLKAP
jgi:ribosomal protein L11 methyltransferase